MANKPYELPERVPFIAAVYHIARDGGAIKIKEIDDAPRSLISKSGEGFAHEWLPETIARLDAATAQLVAEIIAGRVSVWGLKNGDATNAFEKIEREEIPENNIAGPIPGDATLYQIFGEGGRWLCVSTPTEIMGWRKVFWGALFIYRHDLLSRWPMRTPAGPDLAEIARDLFESGETDGKRAWDKAKSAGIIVPREKFLAVWKTLPNATKTGRKPRRQN